MTDKPDKLERPAKPTREPLPRRLSYQQVAADLEKWANSAGLQKPK